MKPSDIKKGHVYYVQFNPVRNKEFDKEHLAVVLKRNNNKITYIVIPLTSDSKGCKVPLNLKSRLPESLQKKDTYAVYDQIRTVNASRFRAITNNHKPFDVALSEDEMDMLLGKIINNLINDISNTRQQNLIKKIFTS